MLQSWKITKLRRRIEQLESRPAFRREPPPDVIIKFIEYPGPTREITYATIFGEDGPRINRQPGETMKDFTSRIISTQERHPCIVLLHGE